MDDNIQQDIPRVKRFKHQSYNQSLKQVHLPAAHNQKQLDDEIGDNESHFHETLDHWRQLNLAPSFIRFANKADPLSASMPLLLHNWKEIADLWIETFEVSDDEGLRPLLDLLQKLVHDLRTTLSPICTNIVNRLLKLLPRSINAAALTALLETFSTLFKFLLVPSIHSELLEETWDAVRLILPKCLPEVQRAMSEVWGSVLRRLKTVPRTKAVTMLAKNLEGIEDASAWVIVFACKSVSQTLHTATTSIFAPLLAYHMTSETPELTYTLIRRVLTALIHHVKKADQFTPLADLLVGQFASLSKSTQSTSPEHIESLRRMLEIISVPTAVRQGSRLAQSHLSALFAEINNLPIVPALHPALLKFASPIFTASEMPLWAGPGLKFLQRAWGVHTDTRDDSTSLAFALKVHGCLAELGWGGWKLVGLPLVLKMCVVPRVLEEEPRAVLGLLAALRRGKKLSAGDTDLVWRTKVEKWALGRLEAWAVNKNKDGEGSEGEKVTELNDILTLSSLFSGAVSPIVVGIVERMIVEPGVVEENYKDTVQSSAWALGICMQTLAKRDVTEWCQKVDLASWTRNSLSNWGWSHDVLAGLHSLSQTSNSETGGIPLEEIFPSLQKSLLSHSRPLRLNTLRLLISNLINVPAGQRDVIKRCLQGEEVSLDVQGVRERVLRIGRVGQVLRDGDEMGAGLCARWLIAQLKVNLRPLWSPAAGALASLSQRFGDVVWGLLFDELRMIGQGQQHEVVPQWLESAQETDGSMDDPWEEEKSWRDPSAHNIRSAVVRWMDNSHAQIDLAKAQGTRDRLDVLSYEFQLLLTLGECPSLAERHNRELVPYFLSLAGPNAPSKLPKQKLNAWLVLFAKFTNPKALHSTEALRALYTSLLSHHDRALQKAALNCLLSYKSPHLTSHEEKIRILVDETRWRDELSSLDFDLIESQDREEVVDVVVRLLFGLMLEKKGRSRGADRRAAVLGALGRCTDEELGLLVDLMLYPLGSTSAARREGPFAVVVVDSMVSEKQQTGFLTLLGDVLRNLGPRLVKYWPALLGATIDLVSNSQKRIEYSLVHEEEAGGGEDAEDAGEDVDEPTSTSSKIHRSIRQLGLKRFADFFRCPVSFDFSPYVATAFSAFISPRLSALDKENTQAPSALLELFYTWSIEERYAALLVEHDSRVLPKIYDCLIAPSVKPAVVSRVFDVVDCLLAASSGNQVVCETVVKPHVSLLLSNLAVLVERTKGVSAVATPLAQRQINILSEIAQYSTDASQASTLLGLFAPLLRKPPKLVPEKVKVDLLNIIGNLMPLIPGLSDRSSDVYQMTYRLLSQLFQSLRSRSARLSLMSAFQRFSTIDMSLQGLSTLLTSLDAYSSKRMDEPDFDTRLSGFASLNEMLYRTLSCEDWLPVLYDMLHFIQDPVELAIRNNASFAMRHFIDTVSSLPTPDLDLTFLRVLFPGLKNGLRTKNELVRAEVLGVIAYAVSRCDHINTLQEMKILLAGGDEEANFFNNILHIQIHRRSRALRRLADFCDDGQLRSTTLAEIFVPLVGNYITSTSSVDHHLVNDAILTTGRMAKHLAWGGYYALVQKYLKLSRAKDASERVYIRTLVAVLDNFHFPMEDVVLEVEVAQENDDDAEEDVHVNTAEDHSAQEVLPPFSRQTPRIVDAVNQRLLPSLLNHLEKHDATTDDNTRIPISLGIVTVVKHLPPATREPQIARLLTVLCQILRSRSQETRDLTRDTLNRIAVSLGPTYLPMIIRESRGALLRGPQLHVLASVVHALLVHVTNGDHAESFDTLDGCVNDVTHVSAEVVFGESGKDVQHEDFKTKMREVRSSPSKGLDSFAIVARYITPPKISSLLLPLRSIMQETESVKVILLVEEVLKRISTGLNSNKHLIPTELLVLCNTLISQDAKFLKQAPPQRKSSAKGDAIVQMKRQEVVEMDHYANNSFIFVVFGLELFNTALRRNRFDFHDGAIISRLDAMIAVVGNTLYSTSAPVLILGMKVAAGLISCPLKSLDKSTPVFVRKIIDIIKQAGNTESEVVQVALKSLAIILRDSSSVDVKEKDLVYLLELLSPDLEDPSRQGAVFSMLRAIVARKFVVPEIYDIMDKVSGIMVTSQSPQVQELSRGVLLQFLLDYPQGKGRFRNQMTFFAKNLSYVYESGRKSVMELLSAIISKFQVDPILEYADLMFVALVMVVANDDSAKCREMASLLIKSLFTRLDDERRRVILSHLHSWASQKSQTQLQRVSSQVYGFVVDVLGTDSLTYIPTILEDLDAALQRSAQASMTIEGEDSSDASMQIDLEWQTPYYVLTVLCKILRVFPDFANPGGRVAWNLVVAHLLFPHAWVRTASCRLLGLLFATATVQPPGTGLANDNPLSLHGMRDVALKLCTQLKSEHLDEALSLQVVKNLFYIGKCFYAIPVVDRLLEDDDKFDETNEDTEQVSTKMNPLPWVFSKLSYQIKSAHIERRNRSTSAINWIQQPLAAIRWFAAMASHMEATRLEKFLIHILTPVYRLREDETIRDSQMDELKVLATELQDLVQSKVGTTKFSTTYNQIRQSALGIRRERKTAKVLQVMTNPEAAAKRKLQRNSVKRESRKRKDREFADGKGKLKRRRQE